MFERWRSSASGLETMRSSCAVPPGASAGALKTKSKLPPPCTVNVETPSWSSVNVARNSPVVDGGNDGLGEHDLRAGEERGRLLARERIDAAREAAVFSAGDQHRSQRRVPGRRHDGQHAGLR